MNKKCEEKKDITIEYAENVINTMYKKRMQNGYIPSLIDDDIITKQPYFSILELASVRVLKEEIKLKKNYKDLIEHITILTEPLGLEKDAPIDEIYESINKLKKDRDFYKEQCFSMMGGANE